MKKIIDNAIQYCYDLIDEYNDGKYIDDTDIIQLIEILKGRD